MKNILFIILSTVSIHSFSQYNIEYYQCFKAIIGIELTPDIKEIHCSDTTYNGISFQMSFICSKRTLKKIVNKLDLISDKKYNYDKEIKSFLKEFDWWNHDKIKLINLVFENKLGKHRRWSKLWYDKENHQLYLAIFDL